MRVRVTEKKGERVREREKDEKGIERKAENRKQHKQRYIVSRTDDESREKAIQNRVRTGHR